MDPLAAFIVQAAASEPLPSGGRYCCVVGCDNNQKRDSSRGIKFHPFPKDPARRTEWNKAINRALPNRPEKLWQGGKNDLVCSEHFVGGKKSDDKDSPAFIPSSFPTHSRSATQSAREKRKRAREIRVSQMNEGKSAAQTKEETTTSKIARIQGVPGEDEDENTDETIAVAASGDTVQEIPPDSATSSGHQNLTTADVDNMPILLEYGIQVRLPYSDSKEDEDGLIMYCDVVSSTEKAAQVHAKMSLQEKPPALHFQGFSDRQIKAFCGVERGVVSFLAFKSNLKDSRLMSKELKVCLVLARLKLANSFSVLAAMFGVSETTAKRVYEEGLQAVYDVAKDCLMWFDKDLIKARMPPSFRALFPQCRAIIDCSELRCERPSTVKQRVQLYSHYKGTYTLKFLVATAPSGEIMFISKTFGGRATDTEITCNSGFLDFLEPGDLILGDKGFPSIEKNINEAGGLLVMPPFKIGNRQFSSKQIQDGYKCAKVRVHVERSIQRMKIFDILSSVTIKLIPQIDQILVIIAFLTNTFPDLIKVDDDTE